MGTPRPWAAQDQASAIGAPGRAVLAASDRRAPFGHDGARLSSFTAVNAPTRAWIDLRPEGTILSTYDTINPGDPGQTRSEPNGAGARAHEAAGQAQEKAQQAAGQARNRVRDEVDTRSTQAGQQAETVASDVRSVGEHLRSEGKDKPAEYADKAAARVAELGDYLRRSDGDAILRDVEKFGRDKPWAVMAGGVVLGIAASRFLKASSSRRYHEQESSPNLPARTADVHRDGLPTPSPVTVPVTTAPVPGA
jgi:hypothetical protein